MPFPAPQFQARDGGLASFPSHHTGDISTHQNEGPSTRSVHLAQRIDPHTHAIVPPISENVAFAYIVGPPATTSHVEWSDEERAAAGVPEGLIRYAVGIEDLDDLKADLEKALASL